MHFKNRIEHSNPLYAEKLSFFADVFEFTILNQASIGFKSLENQRSLLEKIKYQLENYTSFTKKYIDHHFEHSYLKKTDFILKEFYSSEHGSILTARKASLKANKYGSEIERKYLIDEINKLLIKMEDSLFENVLGKIITIIICERPLIEHDHIKKLEYYTPLIVSEFAFEGFDMKELRNVIDIITPNEISLSGDAVETKAILPLDLLDRKSNIEDFFKAAKEYLSNRNLKQQLEGIYFLLKGHRKNRTLLFKIGSVRSFQPFNISNNGVTFFNTLPSKYQEAKKSYPTFFNREAQAYAEITVIAGDKTTALKLAIQKIKEELNYLNTVYKINAELENSNFIYDNDGALKYQVNFAGVIQDTTNYELFEGGKMSQYLSGINNHLSYKTLQMERIYFEAFSSFTNEQRLINLWRYLESFFDYDGYDAFEVQEKVAKILSHDSIPSFTIQNFNLAFYTLLGSKYVNDNEYFGITKEEFSELTKEKNIEDVDFQRLIKIINHPYVKPRLKWQIKSTNEEKFQMAQKHYQYILKEVYEQRNLIVHSSVVMNKSLMKILPSLESIVYKFRRIIAKEVKEKSHSSFKEMFNELTMTNHFTNSNNYPKVSRTLIIHNYFLDFLNALKRILSKRK